MRAFVTFQVCAPGEPEQVTTLGHGALVGRLETAALMVDDCAVSEAHALVSLRKGGLELLALRRHFEVDGQPVSEVRLVAGQRISLSAQTNLLVLKVYLPALVLGIGWEGQQVPLLHDTASLVFDPEPQLRWRVEDNAVVRFWRLGPSWMVQAVGRPQEKLRVGWRHTTGGVDFEANLVPTSQAGGSATVSPLDPLHLVLFYDTVHVQSSGRPTVVIGGHQARLICELAAVGNPIEWATVARGLWSDSDDATQLRRRLDAVLGRLRKRLTRNGFRNDLVQPSGRGLLELRLGPLDSIDDRT